MEASPLRKSILGIYLPCAAAAVCLATLYVRSEDPVYFWDWGMYWNMFRMLGGLVSENAAKAIALTLQSISESDYNLSGVLPLLPVYWLLGSDRVIYVSAICALYVVPAVLITAHLARGESAEAAPKWLAIGAAFTMPAFWNAALRGMIDPVGLIPLGIAALLLWRTRFLTEASWKTAVLIGLMLWFPFLLRRWYAYTLVPLIGCSVISALLIVLGTERSSPATPTSKMFSTMLNWAIAGLTVIGGLVLYQLPLVYRISVTDYGDTYSAYQSTDREQLLSYYANFGPVIGAFTAIGVIVSLLQRNWKSLFFLLIATLIAAWFASLHWAPGVQHYLPIAMLIFPAYFSGISFVWNRLPRPLKSVVPLILVANFANAYIPPSAGSLQQVRHALGGPTYPPLRLDQYPEYLRLAHDLLALDEGATIAVFASSPDLSGNLMTSVDRRLRPRMLAVGEVDLRDRFNWSALNADYALIGRPTPIHLNPLGQRVISIPADEIASGSGIGASFVSTGRRYNLANGVVGEVYRRFRPIPAADLAAFKERFYEIYPQWRADDAAAATQGTQ